MSHRTQLFLEVYVALMHLFRFAVGIPAAVDVDVVVDVAVVVGQGYFEAERNLYVCVGNYCNSFVYHT